MQREYTGNTKEILRKWKGNTKGNKREYKGKYKPNAFYPWIQNPANPGICYVHPGPGPGGQ